MSFWTWVRIPPAPFLESLKNGLFAGLFKLESFKNWVIQPNLNHYNPLQINKSGLQNGLQNLIDALCLK